ncbi:hypothetical protein ACWV26_16575 [Rummeliibacillus sp. JY-2-4R]
MEKVSKILEMINDLKVEDKIELLDYLYERYYNVNKIGKNFNVKSNNNRLELAHINARLEHLEEQVKQKKIIFHLLSITFPKLMGVWTEYNLYC